MRPHFDPSREPRDVRALLRADSADDELAAALAKAGLYVERQDDPAIASERLASGDVAVVDPRLLDEGAAPSGPAPRPTTQRRSLEALCYERLEDLLDRLGDERLPDLYQTVMAQMERALLRLALERHETVGQAADVLGIHRNTLVRRLDALDLRKRPRRGASGRKS